MPLKITSIQKLPHARFNVVFSNGDTVFHTLATLNPKRGNAVKFHDPAAKSALINSGRDARALCDLILRIHQGGRPKLPCIVSDTPAAESKRSLTTSAAALLKVG